jgi:hypothetical protein
LLQSNALQKLPNQFFVLHGVLVTPKMGLSLFTYLLLGACKLQFVLAWDTEGGTGKVL